MDSHFIIDYEKLVAAYKESLTTVLRGFRPAVEFLETWVHDEDDVKSILNIIEAAEGYGLPGVSLHIGPETLRTLERARLEELVARMGHVRTQARGEGLNFSVTFTKAGPSPDHVVHGSRLEDQVKGKLPRRHGPTGSREATHTQVSTHSGDGSLHPVYRDGLSRVLECCSHEGTLRAEPGLELVQASYGVMKLMALVEPSSHIVKKAAYHGAVSDVDRGFLEFLCRIMEGKPILECNDHAVIYMEHELRDHSQPPPVLGIVTPENADPAFAIPTRLVRDLLASYRRKTGFNTTENFYDLPPSARWLALSENERIDWIQTAIARHHEGGGIEVVSLEGAKRVIVKSKDDLDSGTKQSRLMLLETYMKETVEPSLELYMEPMVDQNKMRRMKEEGAL